MQDVFTNNKKNNRNKYNNLSFQKRTSEAVETTNQWKGYVNTMNQDFFDQNKLYLKSVADYKTRIYKKPYVPDSAIKETPSKLPALNIKKTNVQDPAAIRISML